MISPDDKEEVHNVQRGAGGGGASKGLSASDMSGHSDADADTHVRAETASRAEAGSEFKKMLKSLGETPEAPDNKMLAKAFASCMIPGDYIKVVHAVEERDPAKGPTHINNAKVVLEHTRAQAQRASSKDTVRIKELKGKIDMIEREKNEKIMTLQLEIQEHEATKFKADAMAKEFGRTVSQLLVCLQTHATDHLRLEIEKAKIKEEYAVKEKSLQEKNAQQCTDLKQKLADSEAQRKQAVAAENGRLQQLEDEAENEARAERVAKQARIQALQDELRALSDDTAAATK